ncbi:MAG: hypothetical protein UT67_C0002G0029 [Candidatus Magasanikbacteria bacterium GW2011_GWA2_40_10]|uniref:Uncharacterized protein n=1 Tax=Candidatus Magasanikbacteria bacterium GW2011_GWA2_40_10 TaxID=1619037 RepID=A0A0G0SKY1_9BACT|nr:MAG: hypothetical protein UT67_C0002G0029 [Candidatus Magasanikbacteria bacterium GW2011_GWA2_40_10]
MSKWKVFFFDGNRWFGVVNSPAKFKELLAAYNGDLALLLNRAKRAPVKEVAKLPSDYHLGAAKRTRTGEMPNFGFRREHINGTQTLGDWLRENKIDLALATPQ